MLTACSPQHPRRLFLYPVSLSPFCCLWGPNITDQSKAGFRQNFQSQRLILEIGHLIRLCRIPDLFLLSPQTAHCTLLKSAQKSDTSTDDQFASCCF